MQPEQSTASPQQPRSGWWTPPKILAAFGLVVVGLIAAASSRGAGLAYVLFNPVLWIAAVLAAVFLFRQGRRGLAIGVLAPTVVAVIALTALVLGQQVTTVTNSSAPDGTRLALEQCLLDKIHAFEDNYFVEHPEATPVGPAMSLEYLRDHMPAPNSAYMQECRAQLGIQTPSPT